jgi:hypothetical protein
MEDFIFAPIVLMVGFGVHAAILKQHTPREGKTLTLSFAMHMAAGVGQVLLTRYYFKGGDMFGYYEAGVPMADALRSDFGLFFPALVQGFFRVGEIEAPIEFYPGGGSTQSMSAAAIFILFLLGNSLYASTLFVATLSYVAKVMLYRALRPEFPGHLHRFILAGTTLLPTAVFWSCGLLKEPLVMAALGPLVLGLRWLLAKERRALALVMVVTSAAIISVLKAYVLMVLSIAAGAFYFWARLLSRESAALKPFALVTAAMLGFSGFVLGNRYFEKSESEDAAASFARERQRGYAVEGGSNFNIEVGPLGGGEAATQRSLAYEFLLAPIALFTALFRPLLFEARNAVQLANAIEATMLLVLFVQIVRRRGIAGIGRAVRRSPTLLFCALFTAALALGTGLATTNMGTLSRYRAPMMPFFFTLLLVLRYEQEAQREAERLGRFMPAAAAR